VEPDIEKALQYAECRAEGHQWRHRKGFVGSDDKRRPFGLTSGVVGRLSVCSDCKMERIRWFTRSGQIFCPPRYYRPEGYSLTGDAKLTNVEWRRTWLVRELGADVDLVASQ
jgi:hypothetical protein